jgi:hypothetical protein
MIIKIYPENPNPKQNSKKLLKSFRKGVFCYLPYRQRVWYRNVIYINHKAIEKVARIKGIAPDKTMFLHYLR